MTWFLLGFLKTEKNLVTGKRTSHWLGLILICNPLKWSEYNQFIPYLSWIGLRSVFDPHFTYPFSYVVIKKLMKDTSLFLPKRVCTPWIFYRRIQKSECTNTFLPLTNLVVKTTLENFHQKKRKKFNFSSNI